MYGSYGSDAVSGLGKCSSSGFASLLGHATLASGRACLGNGEEEEERIFPVWNTTRERLVTGEAGVIRRHGCNQRRNVSLLVRPHCVPPPVDGGVSGC